MSQGKNMTDTLELLVENIKCGGCAQSIRDGLTALDGIESVDVELESGTVMISGNDLSISETDIQTKLAELGFPVKGN